MPDAFYFSDNTSVSGIQELLGVLRSKDESLTKPHITQHHFANWIRFSLKQPALAHRVEQCSTVSQLIRVLETELAPVTEHTPTPTKESIIHEKTAQQEIQDTNKPQEVADADKDTDTDTDKQLQEALHKKITALKSQPNQETPTQEQQTHEVPPELPDFSQESHVHIRDIIIGFLGGVVVSVVLWLIIGVFV